MKEIIKSFKEYNMQGIDPRKCIMDISLVHKSLHKQMNFHAESQAIERHYKLPHI